MCCACMKNNLLNSSNLCYNLTINVPVVFMAQDVMIFRREISITRAKLILLDSLLQEVVATLPHLVLQKPSAAKMREAPTGAGTPNKTNF